MDKFIERIVYIMAYLYQHRAEVVINIGQEECYLFIDNVNQFALSDEEVDCLVQNEIIELDGGSEEEGYETQVYRLTENSTQRIETILKNKNKLLLSNKKD